MSADIAAVFTELFFGSGAWLGLLLLLSIIFSLSLKNKLLNVLMLPVTIFLGIAYLGYPALTWHALIIFLSSIILVINAMQKTD